MLKESFAGSKIVIHYTIIIQFRQIIYMTWASRKPIGGGGVASYFCTSSVEERRM